MLKKNSPAFFLTGAIMAILYRINPDTSLNFAQWLIIAIVAPMLAITVIVDFIKARKEDFLNRELRILLSSISLLALSQHFSKSLENLINPLIFLIILYAGTFSKGFTLIFTIIFSIAIKLIESKTSANIHEVLRLIPFAIFVCIFGIFGRAFLKIEVTNLRRSNKKALEDYFRNIYEMAKTFRLISMPSTHSTGLKDEKKQKLLSVQSAIEEIKSSIFIFLECIRKGLNLHTCAALWLTEKGEELKVIEASTISQHINTENIPAGYGVTGAVMRHPEVVRLCPFDAEIKAIPYYTEREPVRSLCIVPLMEEKEIRGILCADRITQDPFSDDDTKFLESVASQIVRMVKTEKLILSMLKSKQEQSKLYSATSKLKNAIREDQVANVIFESTKEIIHWDIAVITAYDRIKRNHSITFAEGKNVENLRGLSFSDNDGLVSQAIKLGQSLPWKGNYDPQTQIVFTKKAKLYGLKSLMVIPLIAGEQSLGSVVIGSGREGAFTSEKRRMLQMIVDQASVAFQNAWNLRQLEKTASTDALTGLFNRRVFMEALERKFKSALRFSKPLSIIIMDLDHFKSINDTYGHTTGDEVLKMFADILKKNAREIDMAARWGGEEFIILCEETGSEGATFVAERIRSELESSNFITGDNIKLKITCSSGVATFPADATTIPRLIEKADSYLYEAKKSGRNMVVGSSSRPLKKAV